MLCGCSQVLFTAAALKFNSTQSTIQVTKTNQEVISNTEETQQFVSPEKGQLRKINTTPGRISSADTYDMQDGILVCTLFCLKTLVRKRNCCQRKANCKQSNNSLGKSKAIRIAGLYSPSTSQRSAVQIHLF